MMLVAEHDFPLPKIVLYGRSRGERSMLALLLQTPWLLRSHSAAQAEVKVSDCGIPCQLKLQAAQSTAMSLFLDAVRCRFMARS